MSPLKRKKLYLIRKKLDKLDNSLINIIKRRTSLIKEVLKMMSLELGMDVEGWPPENIEELAKKHEEPY